MTLSADRWVRYQLITFGKAKIRSSEFSGFERLAFLGRPTFSKNRAASLSQFSNPPASCKWHRVIGETPGITHSFFRCGQFGPAMLPETLQTLIWRRFAFGTGDNGIALIFLSAASLLAMRRNRGTAAVL